jgi:hypothetical protein
VTLTAAHPAGGRPGRTGPHARGPRLLLPPVPEPNPAVAAAAAAAAPLAVLSVRSLVDDGWRVPEATPTAPTTTPQRRAPADPGTTAGPLVLATVEAMRGGRPLAQLVRWVTPELYENLADLLPTTRTTGPRRRARILSVHCCEVSPLVAEVTVVVHDGTRVRAAAVRLEEHRGRWRATLMQIG